MTKKETTKEPELFTPLSKHTEAATSPLTEGRIRKGGHNQGPSQVKERPAAPGPMRAVAKIEPAPPPAPRSMLEVIMSAVRDPACDVEKMKALLDMQERVEERDAKKAFTRAFNALQEELPVITKDGVIDHGEGRTAKGNPKLKARFATYPNIMKVCNPLLKKHGFTLSNVIEPSADGARINVVGYLEHIDGHARISRFPLGIDASGGKNNLQGWGSSQQYGMRYNAIALLNIVSEAPQDQDNDGFKRTEEPESEPAALKTISPAQAEELRLAIEDAELPEEKFREKYGLETLFDMPEKQFVAAKKDVAAFKKRREADSGAKKHHG